MQRVWAIVIMYIDRSSLKLMIIWLAVFMISILELLCFSNESTQRVDKTYLVNIQSLILSKKHPTVYLETKFL